MPNTLFPAADPETRASLAKNATLNILNSFNWGSTSIGPIASWPESLRGAVRTIILSDVPMVLLAGKKDGILIYNDGYAVFAGERHPSIFGQPVLTAWPEVADFNAENMRRGFGGESWQLTGQELLLDRGGGPTPAYIDLSYSPVAGDDGKPVAVLAIVQEVTNSVKAGQALEEYREKLDLALRASGMVGTWDWDIVNNVVTADERFAALYHVSPGRAAVGLPIEEFMGAIHPEDRQRALSEISASLKDAGPVRFEYRILNTDGSVTWVVASGRVITDGDGMAVRLPGVVVDITEERRIGQQLAESEQRFRTLADTMPQMVWSTLPDGYHDYYNARWYEYTGVPEGSTDGEGWNDMFHPEDQERAWSVWQHSLETGEPYYIEYRLRHHSGEYRWVLGRALPIRDASGRIVRWFGTCTDIHESKLAQEEREVVAQELSHRIKNIFAVIGGIVSLGARSHPEAKGFADSLRERIFALGKAHDFVRPHSRSSMPRSNPASLHALIRELLQPYRLGDVERVHFAGEDAPIDDGAATPLALLFHELATNAAKYGALSRPDGRIDITTSIDGSDYLVTWSEHGGPRPDPKATGFGSRLISLSVEGQLRGNMERMFEEDGLRMELTLPLASLNRKAELTQTQTVPVNQTA
ncbi:PAS domain-containing protein [Devosia sp. CN2-171]|uniref:PAS domain-containing sensor histidine kinase n=1 Tax=Devosia sp. CN2-171 TaxID=3400909 RepID=UPI003BF89794